MTIKVYLVEDNRTIRETLSEALEELAPSQVVGFAEDEATAVEWLTANQGACDLVIIDIFLKRGSGIGVLRAISNMRVHKIIASNYATDDMRRKCLDLGANRVFDKSNEFEQLVEYCSRLDSGDTGFGDP